MDLVDIPHVDTTRKAKRVRSWYLYEQYKSLEENQIEATQKLRDKSYQERILQKELEERRARRSLCNHFEISESETRPSNSITSNTSNTPLSVSNDDFFDTSNIHESDTTVINIDKTNVPLYDEDIIDEDQIDKDDANLREHNYSEDSLVENIIESDSDLKERLEIVKQNIAKNVHLQLETMIENVKCLEKYDTESCDDFIYDDENDKSEECILCKNLNHHDNGLISLWSKIVSFAYKATQLNHGNCYSDYSSQFMTAVLAFDILLKGVNTMCDILQPYVSPVKFCEDFDDRSDCHRNIHHTPFTYCNQSRKDFGKKLPFCELKASDKQHHRNIEKLPQRKQQNLLKSMWRHQVEEINDYYNKPWRGIYTRRMKHNTSGSTTPELWSDEKNRKKNLRSRCKCRRLCKIVNPMIKLSKYIDYILKDLEEVM